MYSFSAITNQIAVMYLLALIVFILMYIAFWKDSPVSKSEKK